MEPTNRHMLAEYAANKRDGATLSTFQAKAAALLWDDEDDEDDIRYARASSMFGMAIVEHPTYLKTLKRRFKV